MNTNPDLGRLHVKLLECDGFYIDAMMDYYDGLIAATELEHAGLVTKTIDESRGYTILNFKNTEKGRQVLQYLTAHPPSN